MEYIGFLALLVLICYMDYPARVRRLESKVKKLNRKSEGVSSMSKLISELVNKNCKITVNDIGLQLVGRSQIECFVLSVDDDWIKIKYTDKKNVEYVKMLRIEDISGIEILEK